jgi:predicted transcriptional regulator
MKTAMNFRIKTFDDALEDFRRVFEAVRRGKDVAVEEEVCFTSLEAARRVLTPGRMKLLRAIRTAAPESVYELARMLKRDLKSVQADLRVLEKFGLVRFEPRRKSGRLAKAPRAPYRELVFRIAI